MDAQIIANLTRLTDEEKLILGGQTVRKDDYTLSKEFIVNSKKVLGAREIDMRLHTRFIDFPEHGHDYTEFMYVYAGNITHVIDGKRITLQSGDILLLNKHIRHSILRAGDGDIGINFILSNAFLQYVFHNVKNDDVMSGFLSRNFDPNGEGEYLFFQTKDVFPIRNLMDNLIFALANRMPEGGGILSQLVSLLLSYLSFYKETLQSGLRITSPDTLLRQAVTSYLERQYPDATLTDLADRLGYSAEYLSHRITAVCGSSFRSLLMQRRLEVAARLLRESKLPVEEIIRTVGYENQSHFHRMFRKAYGTTPHKYRYS